MEQLEKYWPNDLKYLKFHGVCINFHAFVDHRRDTKELIILLTLLIPPVYEFICDYTVYIQSVRDTKLVLGDIHFV